MSSLPPQLSDGGQAKNHNPKVEHCLIDHHEPTYEVSCSSVIVIP